MATGGWKRVVVHVSDNPLETLSQEHEVQLRLCDALEQIANDLPESVNPTMVYTARELLDHAFHCHMRFEDEQLFPRLRYRGADSEGLSDIIAQLSHEHDRDECFGTEIAEEFAGLAKTGTCRNPDMLGYMLRGFFECQRRHIALENIAVIPVARRILRPEDLSSMNKWLSEHDGLRQTPLIRQHMSVLDTGLRR